MPNERFDFGRFVQWHARLEREGPFLLRELDRAPERSMVDLGCGTGQHALWLAERDCRVVGLDRSGDSFASAARKARGGNPRFVAGSIERADRWVQGPFGMAISIGNTLTQLAGRGALDQALRAAARLLLPRGRFVAQVVHYARVLTRKERFLPPLFLEAPGGSFVLLRLLEPAPRGIWFCPTVLRFEPRRREPVSVVASHRYLHRVFSPEELRARLLKAGFGRADFYGDLQGGRFDPAASRDLVVVAVR